MLLGVSGGLHKQVDAERVGLDLLVFLQGSADGDDGQPKDLACGEVDFRGDFQVLAKDADGESFLCGLGLQGDAAQYEQVGLADLVIGIVAGDGVRGADGCDEGLREIAGERHGAGQHAGLQGFADLAGDFIIVRSVEAQRFMDREHRDRGCFHKEGEAEQEGKKGFHVR